MSKDWHSRACRSRSSRGDQTAISLVQPHRLLVTTLSPDCHKTVTRLSSGCHQAVLKLSPDCHQTVTRLSPVCPQAVTSLSPCCHLILQFQKEEGTPDCPPAPFPTWGLSHWNGHFMALSLQLELNWSTYLVGSIWCQKKLRGHNYSLMSWVCYFLSQFHVHLVIVISVHRTLNGIQIWPCSWSLPGKQDDTFPPLRLWKLSDCVLPILTIRLWGYVMSSSPPSLPLLPQLTYSGLTLPEAGLSGRVRRVGPRQFSGESVTVVRWGFVEPYQYSCHNGWFDCDSVILPFVRLWHFYDRSIGF